MIKWTLFYKLAGFAIVNNKNEILGFRHGYLITWWDVNSAREVKVITSRHSFTSGPVTFSQYHWVNFLPYNKGSRKKRSFFSRPAAKRGRGVKGLATKKEDRLWSSKFLWPRSSRGGGGKGLSGWAPKKISLFFCGFPNSEEQWYVPLPMPDRRCQHGCGAPWYL